MSKSKKYTDKLMLYFGITVGEIYFRELINY